jgi:hypothetical protein
MDAQPPSLRAGTMVAIGAIVLAIALMLLAAFAFAAL